MRTFRREHAPAVPDRSGPAAQCDAVTVDRGAQSPAVDAVSLTVAFGEVLALVGPNGAGKSTLLGVLAGTISATSGTVNLGGKPLHLWSPKQQAQLRAVLPQEHLARFGFTSREIVQMGRTPWQHTELAGQDAEAVEQALDRCDVTQFADRAFTSLSGGERARVALARVLAQDTPILLLDEPTAALDLRHQGEVMDIARGRAREGAAVVVVVHDLNLAAAYADQIAILSRGRLHAHGPLARTMTGDVLSEVFEVPIEVSAGPDGLRVWTRHR